LALESFYFDPELQHNIVSDIEMIPMQTINEAYERMLRSDVKYRFVIDIASLKQKVRTVT
jgi:uncharacterized zinc-type alcohol dehydrogenase-like protein